MNWIAAAGLLAAFCTTVSFVPQAIQTIKTRDTSSISLAMYSLFTFGTLTWFLYGLFTHNLPVVLANAVTFVLSATILFYKIKMVKKIKRRHLKIGCGDLIEEFVKLLYSGIGL